MPTADSLRIFLAGDVMTDRGNDRPKWEFWIDRGGTFTDLVFRNPLGELCSYKLLSDNEEHYQDAIIQGIKDCLHRFGTGLATAEIKAVKMGTTLSTNALLEHKGERVVLAITKGFGDALKIGYQNRPDLFALHIRLADPLYEKVIEINERMDAKGTIITPLDEKSALNSMQAAYNQGFRSIAIVLVHAAHYPQHERQLKKLAQKVGFTQISLSHEVAPVMKLIVRGDTTVVDACLSPLLQHYIQKLEQELEKTPLYFMQSNGGLIAARLFQGKDSIFSGPAAGVTGMIETSRLAGFDKVIGFDMGGTSTDVSHFAGEEEWYYNYDVSGIRMHAPMRMIHTVAAGGGSILYFDGQRYTVGPDSAGANPGPACYRRNGPLTVTDCNVRLGKIQADFFPKFFGLSGNQAIDLEIVNKKFQDLQSQINKATCSQKTAEQIAEGYLQVAVENMANAIKKISIGRGYDVRQYVLNCFGGAAGQHACLVADSLGIETILIHPLAGVLSAYGMGLAKMSVFRESAIERPLKRGILADLRRQFARLEELACKELPLENTERDRMHFTFRVHLRYQDSDTVLVVDLANIGLMKKKFMEKHRQKFGFSPVGRALVIESISVKLELEQTIPLKAETVITRERKPDEIPSEGAVSVFTHGVFHQAFLYQRKHLLPGDCIQGCAIICEDNATTFVEPGWQARVSNNNNLLLTRIKPLADKKINSKKADPALLEVFNNRFMNIAEQMGEVLRNTAASVNIKERLDFSCAIFDDQGELVANAPHIPVHLGSMSETVKAILKSNKQSMHPDDVYILNSPYNGGTHLPDVTVITPVFDKSGKNLLFLTGSRGHQSDIGGITPGSIPASSQCIEEEGVLINHFKIVSRGHFLEKATLKLLQNARYPARNPGQNLADLKAQIAANASGARGLLALVAEVSLKVVEDYMRHVRDNACFAVQKLLARLEDNHFSYSMDDGSTIKVSIRIDKRKKEATIDFTGSSAQHPGNFNAPIAITRAAVLYVLRCLMAENIPLNNGCFVPVKLIIPAESILDPVYPAAVVAGNVETSQCIVDTLLGAFGAVAASQGTCNNLTFGNASYQYYETICGGAGAGPGFNGASAVHTHMTNTLLTDPEILEWRFPVMLESFYIRPGSGGNGQYEGGDGVIRCIRFLENMTANLVSSHRKVPPYGLKGGEAGKTGLNRVLRKNGETVVLNSSAQIEMFAGDVLIIETPGGGGYGHSALKKTDKV